MSTTCLRCQTPRQEKIVHLTRGLQKLYPAMQESLSPEGNVTVKVVSWCPQCQEEPQDQFISKA